MAATLQHRGPDDAGDWTDETAGIALAHRRLEVVGRGTQGSQPMVSGGGRWVLSYNGELYNTNALRDRLSSSGVRFRGTSDTEVLGAGLAHWGLRATLERVEGMFAFAAWDVQDRCLHLVRDRFGEKPLYYGWAGGRFVFASELKAIRAYPGFAPTVDPSAVLDFLRGSCVPAPACIYEGLAKLRPGALLTIGSGARPGQLPIQKSFWSADHAIDAACALPPLGDDEEAMYELERALSRSVGARMVADVPVGALLSGGVDSSLIVALMQQHSVRPVRTFTVAFVDRDYDESADAAAVAAHLGTKHTTVEMPDHDVLEMVPRLPEIWDEPFADSSQLPTYLVAGVARDEVTVALSGDGGDELFAGYNRHAWLDRIWTYGSRVPLPLRRGVGRGLGQLPPAVSDTAARVVPSRWRPRLMSNKVAKVGRVLAASDLGAAYGTLTSHWDDPAALLVAPPSAAPRRGSANGSAAFEGKGVMAGLLHADLTTYLPDDILTKVDRAAMAVSLETRAPFLDRSVFEVAWRLPSATKVRNGTAKWPLRQLLYRHVPRALVERPKMGFGVPLDDWLRGPLRAWAEDLLSPTALERHGILRPEPVRTVWARHLSRRSDLGYELWDLLMLQAWMERWAPR
jgi:asparagine synthase (glutamine-hydrolysing)